MRCSFSCPTKKEIDTPLLRYTSWKSPYKTNRSATKYFAQYNSVLRLFSSGQTFRSQETQEIIKGASKSQKGPGAEQPKFRYLGIDEW